MDNNVRDLKYNVLLGASDYTLCLEKALQINLSVSDYIRFITINACLSLNTEIIEFDLSKKDKRINIRVSAKELKTIKNKANKFNVSVSKYTRYLINNSTVSFKLGD